MALKKETAEKIAVQLNKQFSNGLKALVKGPENEVVASTEIMTFTSAELRRLATIGNRRKIVFSRTGSKVRLVIS